MCTFLWSKPVCYDGVQGPGGALDVGRRGDDVIPQQPAPAVVPSSMQAHAFCWTFPVPVAFALSAAAHLHNFSPWLCLIVHHLKRWEDVHRHLWGRVEELEAFYRDSGQTRSVHTTQLFMGVWISGMLWTVRSLPRSLRGMTFMCKNRCITCWTFWALLVFKCCSEDMTRAQVFLFEFIVFPPAKHQVDAEGEISQRNFL